MFTGNWMYLHCLLHDRKCRSAQSRNIINLPIRFSFIGGSVLASCMKRAWVIMFTMFTNPLLCQKQDGVTTGQTDQIKVNRHYIPVGIVQKEFSCFEIYTISRNYTSFLIPFVLSPVPSITHYPKQKIIAYIPWCVYDVYDLYLV